MDNFAYTRKSRALGDPDDPNLLAAHRSTLLRLAAAHDVSLTVDDILTEIGSGETIVDRPVFSRLLSQWEGLPRNHGGKVFVTELERLTRGTMQEAGRIAEALSRAAVLVVTPSRTYDLRDRNDLMMYGILCIVGRNELNAFKDRMARRFAELRRQGESPILKPPFGYRVSDKKGPKGRRYFEPDPTRWPILLAMCRDIHTTSLRQIAHRYSLPLWVVTSTLRNPVICGYPVRRSEPHHGEKEWKRKHQPLPRQEWDWSGVKKGDYPVAVTLEEWERMQEIIDGRTVRRAPRCGSENAWCRDVVRFVGYPDLLCQCGSNGQCVPTYDLDKKDVKRLYVPRDTVHEAATQILGSLFSRREMVEDAIAKFVLQQESEERRPKVEAAAIERQIAAKRQEYDRTVQSEMQTDPTNTERLRSLADLQERQLKEIKSLQVALEEVSRPVVVNPYLTTLLGRVNLAFAHWGSFWESLPADLRHLTVNSCLKRVWVQVTPAAWTRDYRREVVDWEFQPPFNEVMGKG